VNLGELINFVPRGTFSKNNINIEEEFASPLVGFIGEERRYSELLEFKTAPETEGSSYFDATYILQYNTEYPVSKLDKEFLNSNIESNYKREILDSSEISIKYKGYIQREQQMADKIMRLENLQIPEDFDFDRVESLSIECRQKLKKYAPRTIAQASRISGVSPSDISVLLVYFGR
jgi:tRNA uridine 5-carboxymethylaminomethyl modification enzyme